MRRTNEQRIKNTEPIDATQSRNRCLQQREHSICNPAFLSLIMIKTACSGYTPVKLYLSRIVLLFYFKSQNYYTTHSHKLQLFFLFILQLFLRRALRGLFSRCGICMSEIFRAFWLSLAGSGSCRLLNRILK